MVPTLVITRGVPASGKSTRARDWVTAAPLVRAEVNRDEIRQMLHGGYVDAERLVTVVRDAAITALLGRGIDVICSDTNLPSRSARDLRRLAVLAGVDFEVWDMTDVPVDVCVRRDAARDRTVGEQVIRDMHLRYIAGQPYPLPLADETDLHPDTAGPEPYVPVPGTQKAILVDIDGTVALKGARSPYDETRVNEDRPNLPVIHAVYAMAEKGCRVIFCSGRTDACRTATEEWLAEHYAYAYEALHMRAAGDTRKDSIVKAEIFDQHIRYRYDVVGVFDDRNQVVAMWRSLGLTVFQVADGNF